VLWRVPNGVILDWNDYKSTTDEQGAFAFRRVPPGTITIGRPVPITANSSETTYDKEVNVEPGKTTQVEIGDSGASVRGRARLETPPSDSGDVIIIARLNQQLPFPTGMSHEELQAYLESPERSRQMAALRHYVAKGNSDGSFVFDSVAPGDYSISVNASRTGESPGTGLPFAAGRATVTVPDGAGPDTTINLDEIVLKPMPTGVKY